MATNPAHAVRGPKHSVKKGKTSVLDAGEMRDLLASIDTGSLIGLRDRALIALMGYTFARVSGAVGMRVGVRLPCPVSLVLSETRNSKRHEGVHR